MPVSLSFGGFAKLLTPDLREVYLMGQMGKRREWFLIADVVCIRVTEKAILVRVPSLTKGGVPLEGWVPRSQLHPDENEINDVNDRGMLIIPSWLAEEKGWHV